MPWSPARRCPGNWAPAGLAAQGGPAHRMSHAADAWGSVGLTAAHQLLDRHGKLKNQSVARPLLALEMDLTNDRTGTDRMKNHWPLTWSTQNFQGVLLVFFPYYFTVFLKCAWPGGCLPTLCSSFWREGTQMRYFVKAIIVAAFPLKHCKAVV